VCLAAGEAAPAVECPPVAPPTVPEDQPPVGHRRLTAREVEVLRLIAAGMSNREMAVALCRSERTVERHLENIYRKIGAHSKADATAFAFRHHLA
jgi:DNA-binding NarL/FixJ family response regulator